MTSDDSEFVFYVYNDDDEDPRFSFWYLFEDSGMSMYERPPDGQGMWLKPSQDSDYGGEQPTDALREVIAQLMGDGIHTDALDELPAYERHFVQVIHGTVEQNPDGIPNPVWSWMYECADQLAESANGGN